MSRSPLFSDVEFLFTSRVQTEIEWPSVKGVAEGMPGHWKAGLGDLEDPSKLKIL